MKTIKAARLHRYGGANTIQVEEVSLADPQSGQLLVRVNAAGVNPIDWKIRAGYMQQTMPLQLPVTLGGDFSGVVELVGTGVTNFKVGDQVYGQASVTNGGSGSFAEFVIAPTAGTAAKPKSVGHTEAGGLPLVGVSALQALTENLRLSTGQKVLIHGGAGGIGSAAIQLAKHVGADVATTASDNDSGYVKGLGANTVIDYKTQKFEEVVHDLDAVFDTVGGDTYIRSFKVLKRGGRLVSMLVQPRQDLMKEFGVEAFFQFTQATTERLTRLAELVDRGALKVHVDKIFPLEQASAAMQYLENRAPKGKVVLKIA
jgi:NADPH:quinone reductase-like Zn-dependent oxidoreductase